MGTILNDDRCLHHHRLECCRSVNPFPMPGLPDGGTLVLSCLLAEGHAEGVTGTIEPDHVWDTDPHPICVWQRVPDGAAAPVQPAVQVGADLFVVMPTGYDEYGIEGIYPTLDAAKASRLTDDRHEWRQHESGAWEYAAQERGRWTVGYSIEVHPLGGPR